MLLRNIIWWLKLQRMRFIVWRAENRWGEWLGSLLWRLTRFSVTVVTSALLALWLQPRLTKIEKAASDAAKSASGYTKKTLKKMQNPSRQVLAMGSVISWPVQTAKQRKQHYQKKLEKTLLRLRKIQYYRLVRVDLPKSVLRYQYAPNQNFKFASKTKMVPLIAVSKDLKTYLNEKRITYIEAKSIPTKLISKHSLPLKANTFSQTLLIPDVTGKRSQLYALK